MESFMRKFPKQIGNPARQVFKHKRQFINFLNQYNGVMTLFYSLYDCSPRGEFVESEIDKVAFDFDDKEESLLELRQIIPKLLEQGWRFSLFFSGDKGFHLYIMCKWSDTLVNRRDILANIQYHVIDTLGIKGYDSTLIGDITQLIRVPNTMHTKSGLYAIPLRTKDIMELSFKEIREKAKQPTHEIFFYGKELINTIDFSKICKRREVTMKPLDTDIEIDNPDYQKIVNKFPPCVRYWLKEAKQKCKNQTRWYYALVCRELGIPDKIADDIAKQHWGEVKDSSGRMSKYDEFRKEKQLFYAKQKARSVIPNCETLYQKKFCPGKCNQYRRNNFPLYY